MGKSSIGHRLRSAGHFLAHHPMAVFSFAPLPPFRAEASNTATWWEPPRDPTGLARLVELGNVLLEFGSNTGSLTFGSNTGPLHTSATSSSGRAYASLPVHSTLERRDLRLRARQLSRQAALLVEQLELVAVVHLD
eukprot:COSAG04_NODE_3762_length_2553_cov_1.007746_1_plen_136_part_00